jgi:hypothetical protein
MARERIINADPIPFDSKDILQKGFLQDVGERLKGKGKFYPFHPAPYPFPTLLQEV